jgi:adenylate cyclase
MNEVFTIELLGDGSIPISANQTILQASLAAGIPHYHACGGKAQCSTCRILVQEGQESLSPLTEKEKELRTRVPFPPQVRLACLAFVKGNDVKVHRMIRDETDIRFYIKEDTAADTEYIGQEKELALFFLDIRDFTPFVETYLPFDVIHIMRRLFALFRNAVEAHQGSIIETAGDGFYAVFGFETTLNKAVDDACKAGYQILDDLEAFNNSYMYKNFRHRFQVGIGLHAGKVITGNIGIGVNNNITVTGLPVNIAARLQAATKEVNNSFLISDFAFSCLLKHDQVPQLQLQVKGIQEEMQIHLIGKPYRNDQ